MSAVTVVRRRAQSLQLLTQRQAMMCDELMRLVRVCLLDVRLHLVSERQYRHLHDSWLHQNALTAVLQV